LGSELTGAGDKRKAAKLRCDVLRALVQSPETGTKFEKLKFASGMERTCDIFLTQFSEQCVSNVLSEVSDFVKDNLSKNASSKLVAMWCQAAHLFTQLATQMAIFRWVDPRHSVGQRFTSDWMESHLCQWHRKPNSRDVVHLILAPSLSVFGNEDGKGYDKPRVLFKARVLMGEESPSLVMPGEDDEL
jgi:hypothetical protein